MNIVDVFKVLLDGGHVLRKHVASTGETEFKVMQSGVNQKRSKFVGYITSEQFGELRTKGILAVAGRRKTDNQGNSYTPFALSRESCKQN